MTEAEAREIVARYETLVWDAAYVAERLSPEFGGRNHQSSLLVRVDGGQVSVIVRWPAHDYDGVTMEQYAVRFPLAFLSDPDAVKKAARRAKRHDYWQCDINDYF